MGTGSITLAGVALGISIVGLVLAAVAYWRAGGRSDIEALRARQRLLAEEIAKRIRSGLEESIARVDRAQKRLAELRKDASAAVRKSIDGMSAQLAAIKREAEEALAQLRDEVSSGAQAAQEALARRARRIEGSVQILVARAEIAAAERLADAHEFVAAEDLLEDAVAKVREVRMRVSQEMADDAAFGVVIDALHDAIRSIRARAEDHKRRIDSVLSASDSLLAALGTGAHAQA